MLNDQTICSVLAQTVPRGGKNGAPLAPTASCSLSVNGSASLRRGILRRGRGTSVTHPNWGGIQRDGIRKKTTAAILMLSPEGASAPARTGSR